MHDPAIQLMTENLAEERFLQAIFAAEIKQETIQVSSWFTPSAALGAAEYSLIEHPNWPVALVLNTLGSDPAKSEQEEAAARRILARAALQGWNLTIARPNVGSWVESDPGIAALIRRDPSLQNGRHDLAARIVNLARKSPIDREVLARRHPEFGELIRFIERHSPASRQMV